MVEKSGGNVVMLSFSYRVGLYGFLASERVRQDGDLNVGMLDQRMVLTWVKNHIAQVRYTAGSPFPIPAGAISERVVVH